MTAVWGVNFYIAHSLRLKLRLKVLFHLFAHFWISWETGGLSEPSHWASYGLSRNLWMTVTETQRLHPCLYTLNVWNITTEDYLDAVFKSSYLYLRAALSCCEHRVETSPAPWMFCCSLWFNRWLTWLFSQDRECREEKHHNSSTDSPLGHPVLLLLSEGLKPQKSHCN